MPLSSYWMPFALVGIQVAQYQGNVIHCMLSFSHAYCNYILQKRNLKHAGSMPVLSLNSRHIMSMLINLPQWACGGDALMPCSKTRKTKVLHTLGNCMIWNWPSVNSTSASSSYRTIRCSTSQDSGKSSRNTIRSLVMFMTVYFWLGKV